MAAFSSLIAGAGLALSAGTAVYGIQQQREGAARSQQAAQQQTAISQQQNLLQSGYAISQAGAQRQYAIGQSEAQRQYALSQAEAGRGYSIQQAAAVRDFQTQQAQLEAQAAAGQTGIQVAGAQLSQEVAQRSRDIQRATIGYEQQLEGVRRTAMGLDFRRNRAEQLRQAQRLGAIALQRSVTQGAGTSNTGLAGGRAQIAGQTGVNLLGLQNAFQLGQQTFDINAGISGQRIASADLEYDYAQRRAGLQTQNAQLINQYAQNRAAATSAFYGGQYDITSAFAEQQYGATRGFTEQQYQTTRDYAEQQYQATAAFSAANAGLTGQYAGAGSQLYSGQAQSQFGSQLFSASPYLYQFGSNIAKMVPSSTTPTSNYTSTQSNTGDNWFW